MHDEMPRVVLAVEGECVQWYVVCVQTASLGQSVRLFARPVPNEVAANRGKCRAGLGIWYSEGGAAGKPAWVVCGV